MAMVARSSTLASATVLCILIQASISAPVEDGTSQALLSPETLVGRGGCYYNFEHYDEGDRIMTNEPCLNCTCHNRMLMCYLRVCPFTKAIGQDCTVEKKPDQCCPIITCPQVPVALLTSTTSEKPQTTTALGHPDSYGCNLEDNTFYADGAQVPSDSRKPCELCYCIRNRTACVMQECTLNVEGCKPVYQEGVCCPVRYLCDYDEVSTTPKPLGLITTPGGSSDCLHNGHIYHDGEMVMKDMKTPCEHCYCMRGDIVCAVQECGTPLEGTDCTPMERTLGQCCPNYHCANGTESSGLSTLEPSTTEKIQESIKQDPNENQGSGENLNESDNSSEESQELPASESPKPNESGEDGESQSVEDKPTTEAPAQVSVSEETISGMEGSPHSDEISTHQPDLVIPEEPVETQKPEEVKPGVEDQPTDSDSEASQHHESEPEVPNEVSKDPQVTNEIPESTPHDHSAAGSTSTEDTPVESARIPGEGSCLVEGKTYAHNTVIPTENPCQEVCRCFSSIVSCKPRDCPPAPSPDENCMPVTTPGSCCPTYMCDQKTSDAPEVQDHKIDNVHEDSSHHEVHPSTHMPIFEEPATEAPVIAGIPPDTLIPGTNDNGMTVGSPGEESHFSPNEEENKGEDIVQTTEHLNDKITETGHGHVNSNIVHGMDASLHGGHPEQIDSHGNGDSPHQDEFSTEGPNDTHQPTDHEGTPNEIPTQNFDEPMSHTETPTSGQDKEEIKNVEPTVMTFDEGSGEDSLEHSQQEGNEPDRHEVIIDESTPQVNEYTTVLSHLPEENQGHTDQESQEAVHQDIHEESEGISLPSGDHDKEKLVTEVPSTEVPSNNAPIEEHSVENDSHDVEQNPTGSPTISNLPIEVTTEVTKIEHSPPHDSGISGAPEEPSKGEDHSNEVQEESSTLTSNIQEHSDDESSVTTAQPEGNESNENSQTDDITGENLPEENPQSEISTEPPPEKQEEIQSPTTVLTVAEEGSEASVTENPASPVPEETHHDAIPEPIHGTSEQITQGEDEKQVPSNEPTLEDSNQNVVGNYENDPSVTATPVEEPKPSEQEHQDIIDTENNKESEAETPEISSPSSSHEEVVQDVTTASGVISGDTITSEPPKQPEVPIESHDVPQDEISTIIYEEVKVTGLPSAESHVTEGTTAVPVVHVPIQTTPSPVLQSETGEILIPGPEGIKVENESEQSITHSDETTPQPIKLENESPKEENSQANNEEHKVPEDAHEAGSVLSETVHQSPEIINEINEEKESLNHIPSDNTAQLIDEINHIVQNEVNNQLYSGNKDKEDLQPTEISTHSPSEETEPPKEHTSEISTPPEEVSQNEETVKDTTTTKIPDVSNTHDLEHSSENTNNGTPSLTTEADAAVNTNVNNNEEQSSQTESYVKPLETHSEEVQSQTAETTKDHSSEDQNENPTNQEIQTEKPTAADVEENKTHVSEETGAAQETTLSGEHYFSPTESSTEDASVHETANEEKDHLNEISTEKSHDEIPEEHSPPQEQDAIPETSEDKTQSAGTQEQQEESGDENKNVVPEDVTHVESNVPHVPDSANQLLETTQHEENIAATEQTISELGTGGSHGQPTSHEGIVNQPETENETSEIIPNSEENVVSQDKNEVLGSEHQEPVETENQKPVAPGDHVTVQPEHQEPAEHHENVEQEPQTPVESGQQEPVESESQEPVELEPQEPAESEPQEPVGSGPQEPTIVNQEPAEQEIQQTTEAESQEPIVIEPQEPVKTEHQQPVETEPQPAVEEHQQPVEEETQQPVEEETQRPTETEVQQPTGTEVQQPVETESHQPAETENQQPVETEVQQPTGTELQQPVETENHQPVQTENPQPVETENQQPAEIENQQPVESENQAPIELDQQNQDENSVTPIPSEPEHSNSEQHHIHEEGSETKLPVESLHQEPVETEQQTTIKPEHQDSAEPETQEPVDTATHGPIDYVHQELEGTTHHVPVETPHQEPVETTHQEPIDTAHQESVETTHQEPVDTTHQEPVDTTHQEPLETIHQEPVDTTHQETVDTAHQEPVVTTQPEPVDTTHQEPVDTTHQEPVDTVHQESVDTTHQEPVDTTHQEPVDTTHQEPVDTVHQESVDTTHQEPVDTTHQEPVEITHQEPDDRIQIPTDATHQESVTVTHQEQVDFTNQEPVYTTQAPTDIVHQEPVDTQEPIEYVHQDLVETTPHGIIEAEHQPGTDSEHSKPELEHHEVVTEVQGSVSETTTLHQETASQQETVSEQNLHEAEHITGDHVTTQEQSSDPTESAPVQENHEHHGEGEIQPSTDSVKDEEITTQATHIDSSSEAAHFEHVSTEGVTPQKQDSSTESQITDTKHETQKQDGQTTSPSEIVPSSENEQATVSDQKPEINQNIVHSTEAISLSETPSSTLKPSEELPMFPSWSQKPFEHHTTPEPHTPEENPYPTGFDPEYEDEEGASYGPGTCRYGGKVYLSAQQIPRDDPCDFCFCFRSDIICLQQSCPPPIRGCYQETIKGFCCPRYECHVSMATMLNITTTTTTTTTTLPPHFFAHAYNGAATKAGCQVKGVAYHVGERIPSTSGPCLECRCGANGQMKCDPTVCGPQEALLRQVMDAAVSRRRR